MSMSKKDYVAIANSFVLTLNDMSIENGTRRANGAWDMIHAFVDVAKGNKNFDEWKFREYINTRWNGALRLTSRTSR